MTTGFDLFQRRLRVTAFFDYKGGGNTVDGANGFQCNVTPFACRETNDPTAPYALQARALGRTYGSTYGGTNFKTGNAGYFQPNQFWKFREASVVYNLPPTLTSRIRAGNGSNVVFTVRNISMWTNFSGIDPEANYGLGQTDGQSEFQTAAAPTYYTLRLNLKY